MYYTVTPPYKVKITGSAGTSFTWDYTDNSKDREYIDLMKTISSEKAKYLPISNYVGYTVHAIPHFRNYPNGQGFCVSQLGFYFWKYYNRHVDNMGLRTSTVDYPLFRMGEILVNYAEAAYELGEFSQNIADANIMGNTERASSRINGRWFSFPRSKTMEKRRISQ